jgi:hypothetical protein
MISLKFRRRGHAAKLTNPLSGGQLNSRGTLRNWGSGPELDIFAVKNSLAARTIKQSV